MDKYLAWPINFEDLSTVHRMTATAYGITRRLVESFWRTGKPIPEGDLERIRIAQTDAPTYARHKKAIDLVLLEVMPYVEKVYVKQLTKRQNRAKIAMQKLNGRGALDAKRMREKQALSDATSPTQINITPLSPAPLPFNEGFSDKTQRTKILKNAKLDTPKATFTDN